MNIWMLLVGLMVVGGALAAVRLPNLIHAVLCLAVSLTGLGVLYLKLGAEFVGLAQVLVYVGAVAMLVLFAVLLVGGRGGEKDVEGAGGAWGWALAYGFFGVLLAVITREEGSLMSRVPAPELTVRDLGLELMTRYVVPLQLVAVLLTAALIGGVWVAMRPEKTEEGE